MNNTIWTAIAAGVAVIAVGAVAVAFAADWGGDHKKARQTKSQGRAQALQLIQFDADKDGRITRAEVDAGLTAQFNGADTNADGKLDPLEFLKYNDARKAERKARYEAWRAKNGIENGDKAKPYVDRESRGFDPVKNMDWNLDGAISVEEFSGRTRAQAMRADRDGDGTILTADLKKERTGRAKDQKPASAR